MYLSLYNKSLCRYVARTIYMYGDDTWFWCEISLWRNLARTIYRDGMSRALRDIAVAIFPYNDISWWYVARSTRYRCGDISLKRDIGEISQGSSDISSNYRSNVLLICAIYRRDIGKISEEQSAIFDDYRLHYFCTILYKCLNFKPKITKHYAGKYLVFSDI